MKLFPISVAMLEISLFLAPAVLAQSPDSANQGAASPAPSASATEVPRLIKFSGTLLDAQGRPQSGPVGVTFALYAQKTGGAALWVETQNAKPDENGNYTVLLGAASANGVPAELFVSGEARWLGIQVGQQPEHERILLVSVPYALKAGDAETLGGKPLSSFVLNEASATGSSAGSAAVATSSAAGRTQTTVGAGTKTSATPQAATPCTSVTSNGSAVVNSLALFTTACNIESSLMTQTLVNGFPGVSLAGNNAGLLLSGTGTHEVTVTGSSSSGRLGQDAQGFFFASDTNGKVIKFDTNNGTLNEWMRITSAGNVGIHTQTPAATLDINGNLNLPNTASSAVGVISLGGVPFVHNFGPGNIFFGPHAGNFTLTGAQNTAVGDSALGGATTGGRNTAVGQDVLGAFPLTGNENTAVGWAALGFNTAGGFNTAVGNQALTPNTTGNGNVAVGFFAGSSAFTPANANTSGSNNTFIGYNANPGTPTQLTNATALGANAMVNCSNCMVLGDSTMRMNVGIGTTAPAATLDVNGNLNLPTTASPTVGVISLGGVPFIHNFGPTNLGTPFPNTFVGQGAGNFTTSGIENTGIGNTALQLNTTGSGNTAIGIGALGSNTTGIDNTASGGSALQANTTGNNNTAVGSRAGFPVSGNSNTTGSGNTFIGSQAGPGTATQLTNATAIGANALVNCSNCMVLGDSTVPMNVGIGTTTPVTALHVSSGGDTEVSVESKAVGGRRWTMQSSATLGLAGVFQIIDRNAGASRLSVDAAGNVGIGTTAPTETLSVNGSANKIGGGFWDSFSDGRLKDLHGSFDSGLRQVLQLHPVRYQYKEENALGIHDAEEHVGLVAQEVQRVIPEAVKENNKGYLLVNNDPILWSMLNAIKEQQREIQRLTGEVRKLRKVRQGVAQLQARLANLESQQKRAQATVPNEKARDRSNGPAQGR